MLGQSINQSVFPEYAAKRTLSSHFGSLSIVGQKNQEPLTRDNYWLRTTDNDALCVKLKLIKLQMLMRTGQDCRLTMVD